MDATKLHLKRWSFCAKAHKKKFSDVSKISDVFLTLEETTGYKMPEGVFE